jgi:SAM-dependent methyltransferase
VTDQTKQSVQRQFGQVAQSYATSTVFSQGVDLDTIAREAEQARPALALDVGTAAGHVAFALSPHASLVVGLDLTHAMVVKAAEDGAARGLGNLRFCQGDVEHLPLPDDGVDLVACRFSGHHFPNPDRFAAEAARVLRPGGSLILADTVAPADPELDRWINRVEVLRDPSHHRDWSVAEWQRMLGAAGLVTELLLDWRLDLDFDDWLRRQRTPPAVADEIRAMFRSAPESHAEAFRLRMPSDAPWSFALHCAVMRATKR